MACATRGSIFGLWLGFALASGALTCMVAPAHPMGTPGRGPSNISYLE